MTSLPGGFGSDFRRPPPSQSVSSLSPLAALFKAGGLPPMNPPQVGPTAPNFPSGTHQYPNPHPKFESDSFRFSSGEDMPLYASYGAWKDSWAPIVSGGEESVSWMDPSSSYPLSPADKGTRSSINFPSYEESPINPTISNPLSNPYRFVPETSDPFSKGFRSSVVGPMLRELSDSFSLTSSPYEKSSNYDKYMYQLESCSSPTGSNLNGSNPYQPPDLFDPCTRSFNYFDYMQKEPVHVPVRDSTSLCRTRVTITAPASVGTDSGTKNLKVGFGGAGTSLEGFLNCTGGTDKTDDDLDSPCWKGDQRSMTSQLPFSEGQNGNLSNANPNMVNENPNFNSAQDKKLMSFCADSTSNEEIAKEDKLGSDFELEASSLNKLERRVSCEKNEKGEACEKVCEKNDLPKTDVKLLIKSMHDLSQVLLGSCGDGFNLEECEFELLRGSIENLKSFTARNTKVDTGANNNNVFENIKSTRDIEQAFNERNNQVNLASKLGDNDHKKSILQALEKLPKQGCDVQAELYKNLWLEAEVSLCTLKYELQLAKSKLKIESPDKDNQQVDSSSCSSDKLKSSEPIKIDQSSIKEAPISEPLKKPEPNEKQQSPKIKENKTTENVKIPVVPEGHIGNFNLSQAMDNTVMARLRILKSREQNINYNEDNNNNNNNNNNNYNINNNNNSNLVYPDFYTLGYNAANVRENYTNFSSEWEHVVKESCEN